MSGDLLELFQAPLSRIELDALWKQYDSDGNGSVDKSEAYDLVQNICSTISKKLVDKLTKKMKDAGMESAKQADLLARYVNLPISTIVVANDRWMHSS